MLKNTEAIVLRNMVFGEADLIVTYLSRDYGILQALAKSPRKIKSRFGSSLEPLTYSRIAFLGKENASLPRLTRSDIINPFNTLREDFHGFSELAEVIKMNLGFIQDRSPVKELFSLLQRTLLNLALGTDRALSLLYYKIKFLEATGYMPSFDVCGRCGTQVKTQQNSRVVHDFHINQGAVMCLQCCPDRDSTFALSGNAISFFVSLRGWDMNKIQRIKAPLGLITELSQAINAHISHIRGR